MYDFKNIHIGELIHQKVIENNIEELRICKFLHCDTIVLTEMYKSESLDTNILLRWSKLLEYDFFRVYSQHLILFAPAENKKEKTMTSLPQFRKSLYTKEIIFFVLELLLNDIKTRKQIIEEYNIPKTTLYKWIDKYSKYVKIDSKL
jgi:hypothetical protein